MSLDMPDIPPAGCCEFHGPEADFGCECAPVERALRAWRDGRLARPMTPEQREWCLREIAAVEGHERRNHEGGNDARLSSALLNAWMDHCQDKGLL